MPLNVLISHHHVETALADAWKTLLENISFGTIQPWYSSDKQAEGGMNIGEWREQLRERIGSTDFVLAILSPQSRDRPWILWECGVANGIAYREGGGHGIVIPVLHSMKSQDLTNPLASFQVFSADKRENVIELCTRLAVAAGLPNPRPELWSPLIDQFMSKLVAHRPRRARRPELMAMWRGRFEEYVQSGRQSEVLRLRNEMYASFDKPFEPQDPLLHDLLSKIMFDQKKFRESIEEVDYALKLIDVDVHLLHRRALAAANLPDLDTALATVRQLIDEEPALANNPEIAGLEGRIYRDQYAISRNPYHLEAACAAYTRGMDANPPDYYCAVNVGSLALLIGDQPAADRAFSRALQAAKAVQEQQTATYWADFTVGECLLGQGKTEEALAEYTRGLQRHPAPPPFARDSALKGVLRMAELKNLGQEAAQRFRNLLQ